MWNGLENRIATGGGAVQYENTGTWDMLCRAVFGRITVDCVFELLCLGYHGRCILGVSDVLTVMDEI